MAAGARKHLLNQIGDIPLSRGRRSAAFLAKPAGPMERAMFSPDYRGSAVFGEEALNLGVIAGAAFLLLASLWTSAAPPPAPVSAQPVEQVVVVAHHPGRVS